MRKKVFISLVIMLLAGPAYSQGPGAPSDGQMQNMMAKAAEMQRCMQEVDQQQVQEYMRRGEQLQAEIKSLCSAGQRDQAMDAAMTYSQEILASPVMKTMKRCAEIMKGVMETMPVVDPIEKAQTDPQHQHICDAMP